MHRFNKLYFITTFPWHKLGACQNSKYRHMTLLLILFASVQAHTYQSNKYPQNMDSSNRMPTIIAKVGDKHSMDSFRSIYLINGKPKLPKRVTQLFMNKVTRKYELKGSVSRLNNTEATPEALLGSALHRKRRSLNSEDGSCSLSKEKLLEVKNEINGAFLQFPSETIVCEAGNSDSGNCISWLKLMKCGIDSLTKRLQNVSPRNGSTEKWDFAYKKITFAYEEGDMLRNSLPRELQKDFDLLRIDLQNLERVLNDFKRDSEEFKINSCVENISGGNIKNAVLNFKQIKRNSALIEITKLAYNDHGKTQNLKNIINFGDGLPTCSQNTIVYGTLFNVLETQNELNSPYAIIFYRAMDRCMKNTSIDSALAAITEEIIDSWAKSIRNFKYSDISTYLKENSVLLRNFYPKIIDKVYDNNLDNAKITLHFIRDTPYIQDESICLMALFNCMKRNNELNNYQVLMLAYRVKELMEMSNYPTISEDLKNNTDMLKNSFQSSVKGLIWGGNYCTIRNKVYKEYLYAASDSLAYDSTRRRVFTWRNMEIITQGYWSIRPLHNAEYFTIKNTQHNEYLYASSDELKHDNDRRNVFTWREGTSVLQDEWRLLPVDSGNSYGIQSKIYSEYLYVPSDDWVWDGDRRRVFTWGGVDSNYMYENMKWEIIC